MQAPATLFFALLLQIQTLLNGAPETAETAHDVVIVGAGSAGLYAARTLEELGYEVLVIEASDRIGGRVKSETLGDMRVDLGAEEHYLATGNNPVWPAVRGQYGTDIYVRPYQGIYAFSLDAGAGTCWYLSTAFNPCSNDPDVAALERFWEWYGIPGAHQDPATTLADDVLAEFGVGAGHRAYHLYDTGVGTEVGTNLDKIGARNLAIESDRWTLSSGVRVLKDKDLGYLDALKSIWWDDTVEKIDLLLNSPVSTVDTRGEVPVVVDEKGNRHYARQVIVTVSVGVLQADMIDFVPDLPEATVSAYQSIGMDKSMKIAMRFSEPWWETEGSALAWVFSEGHAGACTAPSNHKEGTASFILVCYPMGDRAAALAQIGEDAGGGSAGEQAIIEAVLNELDATFPQAPKMASATFIEAILQDWGSAPYIRGAYSFPTRETLNAADYSSRHELRKPIADNRLFLAGEATHETNPATVVGALQEGERAALEVHAINGRPGNPPSLVPN